MKILESNTIDPEIVQPSRTPYRVLLVYPNTRTVALSNLGYQQVFRLLNNMEGVSCDMFSLPDYWEPGEVEVSSKDIRSEKLGLRPDEFDMIAFSVSYEPDYLHVASVLEYFHIPLARKKRGDSYPLVTAGGSAIFINPEPLGDICDVFFVGEAEEMVNRFFRLFLERQWTERDEFFKSAASIPGIYIPKFYQPVYSGDRQTEIQSAPDVPGRVTRHWVEQSKDLCTHSEIHEEEAAFKNMALLEVTRGCLWACRFCTAGFIYRPPRLPDLDKTYDSLSKHLAGENKEIDTVGLLGPSVTDHPRLFELAQRIVEEGRTLSFSSLRMETLTEQLVDLIVKSGQKTLTVAVDGPSERMREVINKQATDEFIVEKCKFLVEQGILHLKIYSIIGLPGETDEDIDQFINLITQVQKNYVESSRGRGKIGHVIISLSPLVPKPGTPFQWHPMEKVGELKRRFMKVRKALGRLPSIKLSFGSPHEAYLQTYLSRGDRRLMDFLQAYLDNGKDAKQALKSAQPNPDEFVYRQFQKKDCLPWDIIDHGYFQNFLWQDYQRSLREVATPVCDTATCKICGVC